MDQARREPSAPEKGQRGLEPMASALLRDIEVSEEQLASGEALPHEEVRAHVLSRLER